MAETKPKLSTVLNQLSFLPKKRIDIFLELPLERRGTIIWRLTKRLQKDIVRRLPQEELVKLLEHLDPDEATDLVRFLPPN